MSSHEASCLIYFCTCRNKPEPKQFGIRNCPKKAAIVEKLLGEKPEKISIEEPTLIKIGVTSTSGRSIYKR